MEIQESAKQARTRPEAANKSGRKNKGSRYALLTRVPGELDQEVRANMASMNLNVNDYVARVLALAHGIPVASLTRAENIAKADRSPRPASRFDIPDAADADVRAVAGEFEAAAAESGIPLGAFAACLGIPRQMLEAYLGARLMPPAHLHRRAVRVAAGLRQARLREWSSAFASSLAVRDALRVDDEAWALDVCLKARDDLRDALREDASGAAAWEAIPVETRRLEWDAFLAALVAHEFARVGRQAPPWTAPDRFRLTSSWVFGSNALSAAEIRSQTPAWLADLNLFVSKLDLMEP